MPLKEFTCTACGHEHEDYVKMDTLSIPCPECGANSRRAFRTPSKIDWQRMGAQRHASPEFIEHFDRTHREKLAQEKKHAESHGDTPPVSIA